MNEIRIGILGNVDSGKSTIISVLKEHSLDNGRGLARNKILKHKHEQVSGRTSSITHHYYDNEEKNKILSFIDLAGHEKYYKTTIFGVNGCSLDYIVLMIGSNMGVTKMTIEHLTLILILKIPFIIVFSKIDICPPNIYKQTFKTLVKMLKKYKIYHELKQITDLESAKLNWNFHDSKIIPYFNVSNVKGNNINNLRDFLLNIKTIYNWKELSTQKQKCLVEDIFFVKGVGIVITGTVISGIISKGDKIMIGPFNGIFYEIQIKSIHNNFRKYVDCIEAGKSGCFNIKSLDKHFYIKRSSIKRGMILLDKTHDNHTYREFEAKIQILHHPTTIKENYETTIHCGSIRQIAKIIKIKNKNNEDINNDNREVNTDNREFNTNNRNDDEEICYLRTGDTSTVVFRFKKKPEFIQENKQIIFREGQTKGIGWITKIM